MQIFFAKRFFSPYVWGMEAKNMSTEMQAKSKLKPIYGTTMAGTEIVIDIWLAGDKEKACKELMMQISVNKPETRNNTERMAKDTIEKWIEDNF